MSTTFSYESLSVTEELSESQRMRQARVGIPVQRPQPETSAIGSRAVPIKDNSFSYKSFLLLHPPAPPPLSQTLAVLPEVEPQPAAPVLHPRQVARYQRLRPIGEGGCGAVDLWRDQDIHRDVAVKRLKHSGGPESLANFIQEIHTTGQLEHPGIVPLYDVGQDEQGHYFFVMKHIAGETLEQVISRLQSGDPAYQQRYRPEVCTQIFMQLLHAVQYAHRKGFIHCDIKPANVIVGPFGEVMMLDWGMAQTPRAPEEAPDAGESQTRQVYIRGTPDYMAPEQARGAQAGVDARTDTYSLCALFYELVTRHYYLGPAESVLARLQCVLQEEPLSALQMHHKYGAPPELTNFIRYGLAKDPAQRYQTVDDMIESLQAVINGEIPVVCPCTGAKRFAHHYGDFLNAHPIVGISVMGVAAILMLFGLFEVLRLGL